MSKIACVSEYGFQCHPDTGRCHRDAVSRLTEEHSTSYGVTGRSEITVFVQSSRFTEFRSGPHR